jgi:hypothetical protein
VVLDVCNQLDNLTFDLAAHGLLDLFFRRVNDLCLDILNRRMLRLLLLLSLRKIIDIIFSYNRYDKLMRLFI